MIDRILQMLSINALYGESELIEIAKGKYEIKKGLKASIEQQKRLHKWKRKQ